MSTDAPARLKKQLDPVISLQSDLDATEKALQASQEHHRKGSSGIRINHCARWLRADLRSPDEQSGRTLRFAQCSRPVV